MQLYSIIQSENKLRLLTFEGAIIKGTNNSSSSLMSQTGLIKAAWFIFISVLTRHRLASRKCWLKTNAPSLCNKTCTTAQWSALHHRQLLHRIKLGLVKCLKPERTSDQDQENQKSKTKCQSFSPEKCTYLVFRKWTSQKNREKSQWSQNNRCIRAEQDATQRWSKSMPDEGQTIETLLKIKIKKGSSIGFWLKLSPS